MGDSERTGRLKLFSKKLQAQVNFLNTKFGMDKEVLKLINGHLPQEIKTSYFSKLQHVHIKKEYVRDVNERTYTKIFEILDRIIKEEYGHIWEEYEVNGKLHGKLKAVPKEDHTNPRLQGLLGQYEGFSWDAVATDKTKIDTIHHFKVNVISLDNIVCFTQKAELSSKNITLIGSERIAIELTNTHRKLYLVIYIGNGELKDLQKENRFYLAYTDSGTQKVKSGLAILERTQTDFDKIIPDKKIMSSYEGTKDPSFFSFLKDSQLIL